jgi:hypothetical protein
MKVQIEQSINPHNGNFNNIMKELNEIIGICLDNTNILSILSNLKSFNPKYFDYGSGSSHVWVKLNGQNERYLFVS